MKDAKFSSARLLALYDRISNAEDAIPRLRRFVLDLAVRGKLVDQDPCDEPAVELLKRIAQEKVRLVKEGQIRKSKDFKRIEEAPYLLPKSWVWVRLGEIGETQTGSTPPKSHPEFYGSDVPFLRPGDLYPTYVDYSGQGLSHAGAAASGRIAPSGSILMVCIGTIGKSQLIDRASSFNQQINALTAFADLVPAFLLRTIQSDFFQAAAWEASAKTTIAILNKGNWEQLPIPLPPLAEQHRIVAKVDELMALCDQLEQARAGREAVRDRLTTASLARLTAPETTEQDFQSHARFALQSLSTLTTRPDQIKTLRQTILNLAVRGKLVAQDQTDEPASELLKRIALEKNGQTKGRQGASKKSADDAALDISLPCSWASVTLGELSLQLHYGYTVSASKTEKDVRLLRITDIQDDRVNWDTVPGCEIDAKTLPKYALEAGDLLIARTGGTIGKTFLVADVPVKSVFASYLIRVQPARALFAPFVKLFCGSDIYWDQLREGSRGGGQPNVNGQTLGRMFVPLPPLAEQHRIVAKVDALMALCDQLEASLTTNATTRSKLLSALLHEALNGALGSLTEAAA